MDLLDEAITKAGATGFVAFGPSENADILYLTRFPTVDPVTYFRTADGRESLVVSQMEITRALHQARCGAMTRAEAGLLDIMKEEKDPWRAHARMIAGLTGGHILLSPSIPAILMSELQSLVDVTVDRGTVAEMRSVKDESEIITIRRVQEITDGAMDLAIGLIRSSEPSGDLSYGRATPHLRVGPQRSPELPRLPWLLLRGYHHIVRTGFRKPHVAGVWTTASRGTCRHRSCPM